MKKFEELTPEEIKLLHLEQGVNKFSKEIFADSLP